MENSSEQHINVYVFRIKCRDFFKLYVHVKILIDIVCFPITEAECCSNLYHEALYF